MPFLQGIPGTMIAALVVLIASSQFRRAWSINAGPLTDQVTACAG